MATMRTADSWQQTGGRYERPHLPRSERAAAADRAVAGERMESYSLPAVPPGRRTSDRARFPEQQVHRSADYRDGRPGRAGNRSRSAGWVEPESAAPRSGRRPASAPEKGRLRGVVAVLLVFLVTLAGAAVDSFVGMGLGTLTLVALLVSTAVATWMVRRRDLLSVVVAPPLIFVAVALIDVVAAPSASLNLPTVATLLIRGFPAMGLATGAAAVLALVRAAARR